MNSNRGEKMRVSPLLNRIENVACFWLPACKCAFPIYLALQGILVGVSGSVAYLMNQRSGSPMPQFPSFLWEGWLQNDTVFYLAIAEKGYDQTSLSQAAFFPLFPILIRSLTWLLPNSLLASLLLARIAGLILMIVLYQFAKEECDEGVARRSLFYLTTFPPAFFLWAAYPESLFLCLTVLSFYAMRRKRWWLAGIFGMGTCLLRPNGIFLILPFGFEYLRQCKFCWQALRWNMMSILLLPVGLFIFALYCSFHYGDPFAFVHAQESWQRSLHMPWDGLLREFEAGFSRPIHILAFSRDLYPDLLALLFIGRSLFAFRRLGSRHWTYVLYATLLWLFANSFPGPYPLMGTGRNMLLIFPLFLMLAQSKRSRWYYSLSLLLNALLCLGWLFLFLAGYPVI